MRAKHKPLLVAVAALLIATSLAAQDVAKVNPKSITVKLDNENVRVLDAVLKPGQKEVLHSHPASIVYVLDGGTIRNHPSNGKASEAVLKKGDVLYRDPLIHWAENIGKTTIHLLVIELKNERR